MNGSKNEKEIINVETDGKDEQMKEQKRGYKRNMDEPIKRMKLKLKEA